MALQDDIAADQQAVEAAQAALDAANAKLADDQAKLAALQPHASVLDEMEAEAVKLGEEVGSRFLDLTRNLRTLLGLR